MLRITMMNTPRVELDGKLISFPFKRADALLYYMAVQRSATRHELIDLLWEDCDEVTGLKNLRNTLYNLKKTLGGDFLISPQKSIIMINTQWEFETDYDCFVRKGDLSAYKGAFLHGFAVKQAFAFEEWMCRIDERLRDRYLESLSQEMKRAYEEGRHQDVLSHGKKYLAEDSLCEEIVFLMMKSCQAKRQYAKAAELYDNLKKQLVEELGSDPQQSIRTLYYQIMNLWNQNAEEKGPEPPIGREDIYAAIKGEFRALASGVTSKAIVLLTGSAGVGKSELVNYFLQWGTDDAFVIVRHNCSRSDQNMTLFPWEQVSVALWEIAKTAELQLPVRVISRLEREFCISGLSKDKTSQYSSHNYDRELKDSILTLLTSVSRQKKVMLVLENLQWMDWESLTMLRKLLTETADFGLLMTCRDDCPFSRLNEFRQNPIIYLRHLNPLTREQVGQYLIQELGEHSNLLLDDFFQQTGGNLALLTELVASRTEEKTVFLQHTNLLEARLQALDGAAMLAAEYIAAYPREISAADLTELLGGDPRLVTRAIADLRRQGMIEELSGAEDWYYHFTYSKFQELIYEQIPQHRRKLIHRNIGKFMLNNQKTDSSADMDAISTQFKLAGDDISALLYGVRGLVLDVTGYMIPLTGIFPKRKEMPKPQQVEARALDYQRCLASLRASKTVGETSCEALTEAESLLTEVLGSVALFRGAVDTGIKLLGNITAIQGYQNKEQIIRVCYLMATVAVERQAVEKATRYVNTGRRMLEQNYRLPQGDINSGVRQNAEGSYQQLAEAAFQRLQGCCFCLKGTYDKAAYYLLEAIDNLEKMEQSSSVRFQLALTYGDYARVSRHLHGYGEASAFFKKAWNILQEEPRCNTLWFYVHYARTLLVLEDRARAAECIRLACEQGDTTEEVYGRGAAEAYYALFLAEDETYEEANRRLRRAEEFAKRNGSPLEGAIISYVSMLLKQKITQRQQYDNPLWDTLELSAEEYARRGIQSVNGLTDVYEKELMAKALREDIRMRTSYRANELYSKNNRYMGE